MFNAFSQVCKARAVRPPKAGASASSAAASAPFHVLLTSYEFLMGKMDRPRLCRVKWGHMIIDEGHRLKVRGRTWHTGQAGSGVVVHCTASRGRALSWLWLVKRLRPPLASQHSRRTV